MEREDKILTAIFEQSRKEGSDNNIKKEESDDFCDENFSAEQSIFSDEAQEKDDESEDGSYEISRPECHFSGCEFSLWHCVLVFAEACSEDVRYWEYNKLQRR